MWQGSGYTDQDRSVCGELVKQLNSLRHGPAVCLPMFGPESPIENFRWRPAEVAESVRFERIRLAGGRGLVCGAVEASQSDDPAVRDVENGNVHYEKWTTDIENRGREVMVVKRVDSSVQCSVEKDYVMPLGERVYYVCAEGHVGAKSMALIEVGAQDGFSYRGKRYLFDWHGRLNRDGYANVNELQPVMSGNDVSHATRQICRINYKHRELK